MSHRTMPVHLAFVLGFFAGPFVHGEVVFVDARRGGNGSSWANATVGLAQAIQAANAGDEVWVAAGTYSGPINLKNGVRIYGGFAGGETSTSQADPLANETVISGNGTTRAVESRGNDATALLSGFRIVDGFTDLRQNGGGMSLEKSSADVRQCVFTRNRAELSGGAVAIRDGSPKFIDCRFHGNTSGGAAAAVFTRGGQPSFENCLFYRNASSEAGAIGVLTGSPTFVRWHVCR